MASNSDQEQTQTSQQIGSDLPKEVVEKLSKAFSVFDKEGEPTDDELRGAFGAIKVELSDEQIRGMKAVVEGEKKLAVEKRIEPVDIQKSYGVDGSLVVRRKNENQKELKKTTECGEKSAWDSFQNGVKKYTDLNCFGTRDSQSGKYVWKTYGEVDKIVRQYGSGLFKLTGVKAGDKVGVNMKTREEWSTALLAHYGYSLITTTLYDTFGLEALKYIINQSKISVILSSRVNLVKLSQILDDCASVQFLITADSLDANSDDDKQLLEQLKKNNRQVFTYDEVLKAGIENPIDPIPPKSEDLAFVCYSSGTTGNPKGVKQTHGAVVASLAAGFEVLDVKSGDVHIAFLPLAHVMEIWLEAMFLRGGASIGFYGGDVRKLMGDIAELHPTIFVAVPRLLNRIHSSILAGAASKTGVPKLLTQLAIASKTKALKQHGRIKSYWDWIVFDKIRAVLGGKVRIIATGSAPIAADVLSLFRIAFSATVQEGYGMTEALVTNITSPITRELGVVGAPFSSCEIKLIDVPEMDYYTTDKPHPRGEICIRGPTVMKGYFCLEEKTKEALDSDGWYHSGDVGLWTSNGSLKIIDRRKNIFKLSQGEYVAPIKIENIYARSPFIAQCFVYGHSLKPSLVAIIVPDPEYLPKWAKENGIDSSDLKVIFQSEKLKPAILKSITEISTAAKIPRYEIVKAIHLHPEPFSTENNLMTPTFKVKRYIARKTFQKEIDAMYASLN